MSYVLTIDDDETGDMTVGEATEDRDLAYLIFGVLVEMVTRPGGKREGDLVAVTLSRHDDATPTGTMVCRYERTRTAEQTIVHPEADGWPLNTDTGEPT